MVSVLHAFKTQTLNGYVSKYSETDPDTTHRPKYVSKSDILGPNGNFSDIKNLVSFEREMFGDSSYSYRIKSYYLCQYYHFEIHA